FRYYLGLSTLNKGSKMHIPSVSIIVPARNEEKNIAACLASLAEQNYPEEMFEIIVVNDHSEDSTENIVRSIAKSFENVTVLNMMHDLPSLSPKKSAIAFGIRHSMHEIILTTDADCIAHKDWVRTMVSHFDHDVGVVSGMVIFDKKKEKNLFHKVQSLEFLSLVLAGTGSIGSDLPIIANGANLGYRRCVFDEVNGFKGIDKIKSGDDDLFLQKVGRTTAWKIRCAWERSAIISTQPVPNIKSFLSQRIRWASKGMHYHSLYFVCYLISVYLFYLGLFLSAMLSIFQFSFPMLPFALFLTKMGFDFLLMAKGTAIAGRRDLLRYFMLAELFQIPYVLIAGVAGLRGTYSWKGR
ncbi:glycosyltransferase, partial [bacterium]|nr:glycosyltransferase [candidate division CSSED10-310 bacterium]